MSSLWVSVPLSCSVCILQEFLAFGKQNNSVFNDQLFLIIYIGIYYSIKTIFITNPLWLDFPPLLLQISLLCLYMTGEHPTSQFLFLARFAAHPTGREGLHEPEGRSLLCQRGGERQQEWLLLLCSLPQAQDHRAEDAHDAEGVPLWVWGWALSPELWSLSPDPWDLSLLLVSELPRQQCMPMCVPWLSQQSCWVYFLCY